jgi:hypothetical protein
VAVVFSTVSIIANFFVEEFGDVALYWASHKNFCCFAYEGDAFVTWPHDHKRQRNLLDLMKDVHQKFRFTVETETNDLLQILGYYCHV